MEWRFGGLHASSKLPCAHFARLPGCSTTARHPSVPRPATHAAHVEAQEQRAARHEGGRQRKQVVARRRSRPASQVSPQPEADVQPAEGVHARRPQLPCPGQAAETQLDEQYSRSRLFDDEVDGCADPPPPAHKQRADAVQSAEAPRSDSSGRNRKQKQRQSTAVQPQGGADAEGLGGAHSGQAGKHQQPLQRRRQPPNIARRHKRPPSADRQASHDPSDRGRGGTQQAAATATSARHGAGSGTAHDGLVPRQSKRKRGLELLLERSRNNAAAAQLKAGPANSTGKLTAVGTLMSLGLRQFEAEALLQDVATAADAAEVLAQQVQHVCGWLTSAGIPVGELAAVLRAHPAALTAQPLRDWLPKIEFMQHLGLRIPQIERMIRRHPPWLVGTRLQQLPETAAAVHRAGVPRERVPAVLCRHPAIFSRQPADVLATGRVLDELLGTPGAARHAVPRRPQLLSVDLHARHRALLETLGSHGLTAGDAAQICAGAPELLAEYASTFQPVLSLLQEQGFTAEDTVQLLSAAPRLLLQDAASMRTQLVFLLQHRGKPSEHVIQDVVRYPRYFDHSLASCIGPRLEFLQARDMADKCAQLSLAYLFSRSDTDFAEQVLIEDYLVWKAQWERTHGVEYGWRPTKVRSVVQPSQAIGAEGRYAVV